MTTMKPCPRCHSTEHLHIEIVDDCYRCMMASRALFGNGDALCDLDSSGPGTRAKLADLIEGNEQ